MRSQILLHSMFQNISNLPQNLQNVWQMTHTCTKYKILNLRLAPSGEKNKTKKTFTQNMFFTTLLYLGGVTV